MTIEPRSAALEATIRKYETARTDDEITSLRDEADSHNDFVSQCVLEEVRAEARNRVKS